MRGSLLLIMLTATLAHAAWNGYVEVRDLRLDASGLDELAIDAGAGSLAVVGDAVLDEIVVTATINVPDAGEEEAREIIDSDMVLTLERSGDSAVLNSYFESSGRRVGDAPTIGLEVRVPERIGLAVDDGSGSIKIENVRGAVNVDDGSGSISMTGVGDVTIDDGSGSITVEQAHNDVRIVDGSGSITVRAVAGSVYLDDGSGGIDVSDVARDLIIEEDGSGSVRVAGVQGRVEQDN